MLIESSLVLHTLQLHQPVKLINGSLIVVSTPPDTQSIPPFTGEQSFTSIIASGGRNDVLQRHNVGLMPRPDVRILKDFLEHNIDAPGYCFAPVQVVQT